MDSIEIFEEKINALGLIEMKLDPSRPIRYFTLDFLEDNYYICDICFDQTVRIFSFRLDELHGRKTLVPVSVAYEGVANETALKIMEKTVIETKELQRQERKKILEEL